MKVRMVKLIGFILIKNLEQIFCSYSKRHNITNIYSIVNLLKINNLSWRAPYTGNFAVNLLTFQYNFIA